MLASEQTEELKKEIISQIEKSFPEDKKEFAVAQIKAMNSEQLEDFLKKNKIEFSKTPTTECIFCSIISGNTPSYKIDENSKALAVLEINPLSKGHSLIIPKEHISSSEKISPSIFSLAKKIGKKLKVKFKPKNLEISSANIFGHEIINVIPIYGNEKSEKRTSAKPEELLEIQKSISKSKAIFKKPKKKKITIKESEPNIWLPKRIP